MSTRDLQSFLRAEAARQGMAVHRLSSRAGLNHNTLDQAFSRGTSLKATTLRAISEELDRGIVGLMILQGDITHEDLARYLGDVCVPVTLVRPKVSG